MSGIISVDAGTTHIKSILFNEEGLPMKTVKVRTPLEEGETGSFYQPDIIWETVNSQILSLLAASPEVPQGIVLTGMAEAGLVINQRTEETLTNIVPWFDKRTEAISSRFPDEDLQVFKKTGLIHSFKYGIFKFVWLIENELDGYSKNDLKWLSICDFLAWKMTGKYVTDPTFAARTYVYDVTQRKYDESRIKQFELTIDNFPEVKTTGVSFGKYKDIPVAIGGHDHICAAYALLYDNPKGLCNSAGTSETYLGLLQKEEIESSGFRDGTGLLYGPFVDDRYFFMANLPSSGHSVEWFRKRVQQREIEYDEMNAGLLKQTDQPTGVLYYPYLTGIGTPDYCSDYKAMFLGLSEKTDGMVMMKAVIEGIQFQARRIVDNIEEFHEIDRQKIFCAGGSVLNETMMQIKSNVLESIIDIPRVADSTLTGAAAIFIEKNLGKEQVALFLRKPLEVVKQYQPSNEISKQYLHIYKEEFLPFLRVLQKYKNGQI